jgi:ABC-type nitrate/sulfonate/bicarbonate transport system substrate-binding protein
VLAAHPKTLASDPDTVKAFLAATARGYAYAAQNPAEAAQLLCAEVDADVAKAGKQLADPLDVEMVAASQQMIGQHYLQAGSQTWGRWVD